MNYSRNVKNMWLTSVTGTAMCVLAPIANAQTQAATSPAPQNAQSPTDDIVVTAQRRSERLQEVPISIAVMPGAKLERGSTTGTTDALSAVAGVSVSQSTQNGGTLVTMRGVSAGNQNLNGASTVGFYIDALPFGFVKSAIAPNLAIYDLDRIEVLRGPQGTLYGASSQNGVVRVLTHDADLTKFELKLRGSASTTYRGSDSFQGDMAVNVPVIDDMLAARLVVGYHDLGGWLDRATEKDANHSAERDFRGRIKFQPDPRLTIGLTGWISTQNYGAPPSAAQPYFDTSLVNEPGTTRIHQYGGTIAYDFDGFSVSEASGWLKYDSTALVDYAPPLPNTILTSVFRSKEMSHELNIRSSGTGDWRWTAGGIYRKATDEFFSYRSGTFATLPLDNADSSSSFAVFGELTHFLFGKHLELMVGLRYFHDDVRSYELQPYNGIPGTPLISSSGTSKKLSPRLVATWHESHNLTFYASYSEGFRSGYPQAPTVQRGAPALPYIKPDNVQNYEVGSKGSFAGGRITYDAALYYIKWKGVQQTLKVPYLGTYYNALVNGDSASGVGVDFSLSAELFHGLRVSGGFDWNNLRTDSPIVSAGVTLYNKGERLALSPEFTGNASVDYTFDLSSTLQGHFSLSGQDTSRQDSRTVGYISSTGNVFIAKTSFSVERGDRWTATVFVDNLNNFSKIITPSNIANNFPNWVQRARPRTIGLQLEYQY